MSQVRKAHSVEILDRRLRDCEAGGGEAMELIGIYDELSRVERKWLQKAGELEKGRKSSRPLANAVQLDQRFDRLSKLVDASLRGGGGRTTAAEIDWLQKIAIALLERTPLSTPAQNEFPR